MPQMRTFSARQGRTIWRGAVSRVIDYDNRAFDVLLPSRAESITSVTIDGDALDDSTYQLRYGGNSVRIWFLDPFVWTTGSTPDTLGLSWSTILRSMTPTSASSQ